MDAGGLNDQEHDARGWFRPVARESLAVIRQRADDPVRSAAFRTELADAMHAAARAKHGRIVSDVEERQAAYVSAVHSRAAAEVDAMRTSADAAASDVEAWAAAEAERIDHEREHRVDAARVDFQQRLESHESLVEREIADVRDRVNAYRAEVDAFFSRLDAESDPATIAELAAHVPVLPAFDDVAAAARTRATAGSATPQPADSVVPVPGPSEPAGLESTEVVVGAIENAGQTVGVGSPILSWATESLGSQDPAAQSAPTAVAEEIRDEPEAPIAVDEEIRDEPEAPIAAAEEQPREEPEVPIAMDEVWRVERPAVPIFTEPAVSERESEPAASAAKPKDLIRERLRYIAERRAALSDANASTWTTEPTGTARS